MTELFNLSPSPSRLESTFESILNDKSDSSNNQNTAKIGHLPAGTALNRTKWAAARDVLKQENGPALEIVESALLHVWFDTLEGGVGCPQDLCKRGLHGDGSNIWFDKSYTYVFLQDGQFVLNIEHAWADGAVTCHVCEETNVIEHLLVEYHPDTGKIVSNETPLETRSDYELVMWSKSSLNDSLEMIKPELKVISDRINLLDIDTMEFKKFGKDTIKKWKCSPDAIVQMSMQLANFKTRGKFVQTYEAGLARIFKDGRTETIRSCSSQSIAFVKEMLNKNSDTGKNSTG